MSNQDITPDFLRGFIVPAEITTEHIWDDQSTFTQQGRRTGVPKSNQGRTGMVLSAIGNQGDQGIDIKTTKGGTAGSGAGFQWKFSGESEYYGFDPVNIITGFRWLKYSSSSVTEYQRVDAVSHNGTMVGVYESFGTNNRRSIVAFKQVKSGSLSTTTLFTQTYISAPNGGGYPSICRLSDGSYLIGYIQYTGTDIGQIKIYRSVDDGGTWDLISSGAFDIHIDLSLYDIKRIRMTANNNSILLVAEITNASGSIRNLLVQYASIDNGCTFRQVGISSDPARHRPDVVTLPDGSFGLVTIENTQKVTFVRLPYARFDVTSTTYTLNETVITDSSSFPVSTLDANNLYLDGRLTVWIDDDGVLYCAIGNKTDKSIKLFTSDDNGETWLKMSGNDTFDDANIFQPDYTGQVIKELSGLQHEGRSVLFGQYIRSISQMFLGGYTTRTFPSIDELPKWYQFARFDHNWLPLFVPNNGAYSTVGSGSASVGDGYVQISTAGNNKYFYKNTSTTTDKGVIIRTRFRRISGGASSSNVFAVRVLNSSSGVDHDVTVRLYSTGFKICDNNDSGTTLHTESVKLTLENDFIIAVAGNKISIYYRQVSIANQRVWNEVHVSGLAAGIGSTSRVYWGHLVNATAVSRWSEFHISEGDSTGLQMTNQTAAESFRQYPVTGDYLYLGGGVLISTAESPTYEGDTFEIAPKYDFPIERVIHDVSTSPRVQWRSEQTSGGAVPSQRIAFLLDTDIGTASNSYTDSQFVGFHLSNINFRQFNVVRYNFGTSSWVTVDSIDTSDGMNGKFIRVGSTIIPAFSDGTDVFYLHYGECKNWIVELDDGVNVIRRRVRHNSEGLWKNGFNGKQPVIHLKDCDNTEPYVGDVRFVPDVVSVLVRGDAQGVGWGIQITSQNTIDNDFRIGTMLFGSLFVVAPTYGRGRAIAFESNRTIIETRDGTTIGRKYSDGGRVASISWTDGVDTSPVMGDEPNPNYWTVKNNIPIANYGDAPFQMLGLTRYVAGGVKPVVYLPSFEQLSGNSLTLNRYNQHLFGRTDGTVSIDHVVGDELQGANTGEVFRIATVNIREIE